MYELIQINDKQVKFEVVDTDIFTTSLDICEVFNKNHNHIIAKIKSFPQDVFGLTNFRPSSYKDLPHYKVEDLLADVRSLTPIIKMN